MPRMVRVALDAMGGESAPRVPVRAAREAVAQDQDLRVLLVGRRDDLEEILEEDDATRRRLEIVSASQTVAMDESPVRAVRRKPDSSIVVGLRLQREEEADAFVSAGSTGAIMAASHLVLGPLPGVDRPAVAAVFPTASSPVLVLDVGATVGARPGHLHQFAHLGAIYFRDLMGAEDPRVGLLNVGEEAEKGGDVVQETHRLLAADPGLRFVGNVEGDRIIEGDCDVLVSDGFAGNVLLKFYESVAGLIAELAGEDSAPRRQPGMKRILEVLDYTKHGGAPLLGVDGVSVVCHGASPSRAVRNALGLAARCVRSGMVRDLARDLNELAIRTVGEQGGT